jgi:hypothetical protein
MGLYDQLTPAEVSRFDQERADIANTYSYSVEQVRCYRELEQEAVGDMAELFIALVNDLRHLDKTRLIALLVEGLIRASAPRPEAEEGDDADA